MAKGQRPRGRPRTVERSVDLLHEIYGEVPEWPGIDLRRKMLPWEQRHAEGKAIRTRVPRGSHGPWSPPKERPDPLSLLEESDRDRVEKLIPLRMGRMAASRFGFLRGSAVVMAWDLAHTPVTGVHVLMDGDAHLSNFGLFGTVERDVVLDLNDFDESIVGPWEWDLKRLLASVNVAARDLGLDPKRRREAVESCIDGYSWEIRRLESKGAFEIWHMFLFTDRNATDIQLDPAAEPIVREATKRADLRTSESLLDEVAERGPRGGWHLREDPPVQTRVPLRTRHRILDALDRYALSLPRDRRYLLTHYHVVDVVEHVVGVGSVGTRAYLVLLFGNGEKDPLFLQMKEAVAPAATPYVPRLPEEFVGDQGRRVITAQTALNGSPDILLGWTRMDDRSYYVRQMRNMKGSVPIDELKGRSFPFYVRLCGAILARAHTRGGDAAMISGYWGKSDVLDRALVEFAERYGDQTEADHAALVKAIEDGRVKAITGV
jgi:uncharacterized protein (DUF2252 family)